MRKTTLLFAVLLLSVAAGVRANDDAGPDESSPAAAGAEGKGACFKEMKALCPDFHPGDGKWGACVKEHKDQLSDKCKAKMEAKKEKFKAGMEECKEAAQKACPDQKMGTPEFRACAKAHKDELPPKCVKFWEGVRRRQAARRAGGAGDGSGPGDGSGGGQQQGGAPQGAE